MLLRVLFSAALAVAATICSQAGQRNVTVFTLGGTIAAKAKRGSDTTTYDLGVRNGTDLFNNGAVAACDIANIAVIELANVGSHDIDDDILKTVVRSVHQQVEDSRTHAVIVTTGTDTLDQIATLLDSVINTSKSVVVTAAMRPASAMGADGPMNLFNSVALAASESARDRGVLLVMNERILSSRYAIKVSTDKLDAFQALEQGSLGAFVNGRPHFFYEAARPIGHYNFSPTNILEAEKLPRIDILMGHLGAGSDLFKSAIDNSTNQGAKAVVLAGSGNGYWPSEAMNRILELADIYDVMILKSRHSPAGFVDGRDGISCGFLGPAQCRVIVQLCLLERMDRMQVASVLTGMAGGEPAVQDVANHMLGSMVMLHG
jgi:L-asparaginase